MPNATSPATAPRRRRAASTQAAKTPREQLARFSIDADHCPQVLLRVLGLMARDGTVPVTVAVTRAADNILIEVELDGASATRCEHLKLRIEEFPSVRKVLLSGSQPARPERERR